MVGSQSRLRRGAFPRSQALERHRLGLSVACFEQPDDRRLPGVGSALRTERAARLRPDARIWVPRGVLHAFKEAFVGEELHQVEGQAAMLGVPLVEDRGCCPARIKFNQRIARRGHMIEFLTAEDGQDTMEYTLLLGFIALAAAAIFPVLTSSIKTVWQVASNGSGYVDSP